MPTTQIQIMGRTVAFNPNDIAPPLLDEAKYPQISSLAIDVAGHCNLSCSYCAESATMPKRQPIQKETLNQALTKLFLWSKPKKPISIHLGSGEPLLFPQIVKEIGEKAKKLAKKHSRSLSLFLTTNGTCLTDDIIEWLIKDEWNVKISLDGDIQTHNKNRKYKTGQGTYQKASEAAKVFAKRIPDRFSTTSVLCRGNDPSKIFYSIASLGVKRIEMVPVAVPTQSELTLHKDDLDSYRQFIIQYAKKLINGEDLPTHIGFHNKFLRVLGYKNHRTPCGAGRNFFAVSPKGEIYPCFRFLGIKEYLLGDLDGINTSQIQNFLKTPGRTFEKRERCQDCWSAELCGGPCFACAELFRSGKPLQEYCEMVHSESEAAIWLVDVLKERNPEQLLRYMGVDSVWKNL